MPRPPRSYPSARARSSDDPHRDHRAAFDAIGAMIWQEERWINKVRHLRGPGESYSDVILRLAAVGREH